MLIFRDHRSAAVIDLRVASPSLTLMHCLIRLISIARYAFLKVSQYLLLRDMKFSMIVWLTCILYCDDAGPGCLNCLQAQSGASYYGYHIYPNPVFLRRRRSFTSRKPYVCLKTFFWFLHLFIWARRVSCRLFVLGWRKSVDYFSCCICLC